MSASIFTFGEFELYPESSQISRNGVPVKLENVPFQLLQLLLERTGMVVSREEIVNRLWGEDVFVDVEQGINTAIRKIRLVLQDKVEQPRYVQTLVGKGYRFLSPRGNKADNTITVTTSEAPDGLAFTGEELGQAILCAAGVSVDDQAIRQIVEEWKTAYNNEDAAKVASLYAEGADYLTRYSITDIVHGRAGVNAHVQRALDAGYRLDSIQIISTCCSGDLAYAVARYVYTNAVGLELLVFKKIGGIWLILAHHESVEPESSGGKKNLQHVRQ